MTQYQKKDNEAIEDMTPSFMKLVRQQQYHNRIS